MTDRIEGNDGSTRELGESPVPEGSTHSHNQHLQEESLKEQLQFEQLLSELSATFVNLPTEQIDPQIESWLQRIGEFLKIDMNVIWQKSDFGLFYDVTHFWSISGQMTMPNKVMFQFVPWLSRKLSAGETVICDRVSDLPDEAENERRILSANGTKSVVAIPMTVSGLHIGAISFGGFREERVWPDSVLRRLHLVSRVFADTIARQRSQEVLKKERDRAQRYLDIAGTMLVALDSDQRVTMINQKGCELLGYSEQEIIGRQWFDTFVPTAVCDIVRSTFLPLMAGEKEPAAYYENPIVTKGGEERLIAWNNTLLKDEQGRIVGSLSSGEDITERRQMERELRDIKERFERVTRESREMVWEVNVEGVFTYVSPACMDILGYAPEEMIGKMHFYDLQPEEKEKVRLSALEQIARRESFHNEVNQVQTKDGQTLWFLTSGAPLHDEVGNLLGYAGSDLDITDRREVEEMLAAERRLFIGGPTVVFKWKAKQGWPVEYVSPNVTDQFGYRQEQFTGGKIAYAGIVHPDDVERIADELRACDKTGEPFIEQEYRIFRSDGECRWVRDFTVMVRNQGGEITHYHGYVLDITQRKRADEALRESEERFLKAFNSSPTLMSISSIEEGRFVEINETFLTMLGFEREQVIGRTSTELNLFVEPDRRAMVMQAIADEGHARNVDSLIRRRDGKVLNCLLSAEIIELRGKKYLLSVVSDVSEHKRFGALLQYTVEGTSAATGRNFFRSMVKHLATALEMRYALIAEVDRTESDTLTTLAVWNSGKIVKNFRHTMTNGPCEDIFKVAICLYPSDVRGQFPNNRLITELGAESILGMPLSDSLGQPLGVLVVMNDRPFAESIIPHAKSLVSIFAARAAAELERIHMEEELRQATEKLKVEREELAEKNIALKQVLSHLELEKIHYKHEISASAENLMMPFIRKLRSSDGQLKNRDLDALENAVESIVGKDIDQFLNNFSKLTPRERDICERIKQGMTSKQIADDLSIDVLTVHKHRDAIRRKLQLKHRGLNLTSFLRSR